MSDLFTLGRVRLVAGGDESASASGQPKRVALLAYLAVAAHGGPARRDMLLPLFWPELGDDEARRALRQALHYLRRVVGDVFVSEGDEVGIRPGALRCDTSEFERLIDAGRPTEALALYHGDFLEAFHVDDASPEYEEWVDRTRARLRRMAATAAWAAADAAEQAGEAEQAIAMARRARDLVPDNEAGWRRLMALHDRVGDRAGALREFDELFERLAREFDAKPAAETVELAESIRTSSRTVASDVRPSRTPAPAVEESVAPTPTVPVETQRRPRRRSVVFAALCIAIVAAASVAYITLTGSDSGPSLVAQGSLAAKDRLLVADFADQAGDSLLSAAVTEALRIDLAQSPIVRVLTPQEVRGTLALMPGSPSPVLNDSLAHEVAVREGVKAIVSGSVGKVGAAYAVSARLVGAQSGEPLAAFREIASDSSDLIGAVERVSKQLRRRIGESLRDLRATPKLEAVTTPSLDALRKFSEGTRQFLAGRRSESIALYEQAVKLDTGFATAYSALAMAYYSIAEPGRGEAASAHAFANRERLPFIERNILVASHALGRGDVDIAIDAYTRLLERYPDEYHALNNLALLYRDRRQFATAESLFVRAAQVDSTIPNFYFGIQSTQLLRGDFMASRHTLDLIERRFPGNPIIMNVEIQDAAAQQNWERAERQAEAAIAAYQSDTLALVDPFEALSAIAMTQGRLADAEGYWRTQLALSAALGSRGRHLYGLLQLAYLQLRYRNAPARALALVDSSLARTPLDSVLPGDRPYDDLARFYANVGHLTRAREMLAAAQANDRTLDRLPSADRAWTRGVIALAEGQAHNAESDLRQAADGTLCTICALPDLARAYERAGKPDAAVVAYERYLTTPWLFRYEVDASELGWALKRLGELYEARGESKKASAVRARLLQLWHRADPDLQPVLAAIRGQIP